MAVLAVFALAVTVLVAQRALGEASDIVVRGEGDVLMSSIASELTESTTPPDEALLAKVVAAHGGEGLRYLAVVGREGKPIAEAGRAEIRDELRPGQSVRAGRRVRVAGPLVPRRAPRGGLPPPGHRPPGMPLLVAEFEPPVIQELQRDLTRILVVSAAAGAVLLAFAIAWSRSAARLSSIEEKAARDERLVALGGMSSVMAHELRNPLAALKGHAQLLVEDLDAPADAKKKAKAERVVNEAERIEALTTSLLDFVRDGPIERSEVSPRELVARALEHLSAARVDVHLENAPEVLRVDAGRLARAVHNLVDNALQVGGEQVELLVETRGRDVVVEVRDHGPGLPEGADIFEPFVTTRVKGTGLGLPVARRIAEQHGGTLAAANHPSGGAVFTLRWPLVEP